MDHFFRLAAASLQLAEVWEQLRAESKILSRQAWALASFLLANTPLRLTSVKSILEFHVLTDIIDPAWFDPADTFDYSGKDWDYARAMGKSSGALSTMPWEQLEPILQSLWSEMKGYPPWEESRFPIYQAWKQERLQHPDTTRG